MNKLKLIMRGLLLLITCTVSASALAFSCVSGGVTGGSGSNWTVQVNPQVLLKDTHSNLEIADLTNTTTCSGNADDNLRVYSSSVNPALAVYGFTGVLNINGTRRDMPTTGDYIWPTPFSSATINGSAPLRVKLELKRNTVGAWGTGAVLPAGTVLATLVAEQRSGTAWGWHDTWRFVLNAPLVIPAYTCNVTNPANRIITLPTVEKSDLRRSGQGRFTESKASLTFNLDCNELTTVDLSFSGTTMTGKDDVLVNQESGNDNIGIQIVPKGSSTAVKFDNVTQTVVESASANETLDYDAYYYYNGGDVQVGKVKATAIYTFTYR